MNGKISKSLCTIHSPGLIDATAHSEPAQRIAARILRHCAVLDPQRYPQMSKQDKQRHQRVAKMSATLQIGEAKGRW